MTTASMWPTHMKNFVLLPALANIKYPKSSQRFGRFIVRDSVMILFPFVTQTSDWTKWSNHYEMTKIIVLVTNHQSWHNLIACRQFTWYTLRFWDFDKFKQFSHIHLLQPPPTNKKINQSTQWTECHSENIFSLNLFRFRTQVKI